MTPLRHDRLAQLDKHETSKPVMVSCKFNFHWSQHYFYWNFTRHLDANFVQNARFVLFTKTSNVLTSMVLFFFHLSKKSCVNFRMLCYFFLTIPFFSSDKGLFTKRQNSLWDKRAYSLITKMLIDNSCSFPFEVM